MARGVRRDVVRLVLGLIVLAVFAGVWVTHGMPKDQPTETGNTVNCLPFDPPKTVAGINKVITGYRRLPGFVGADVGADARLSDGRTVWMFADTLRDADFDGQRLVRNSMLMFSPGCATVVLPADHGAIIPDRSDGVGYWPMSVTVVRHPGFDVLGVSAQRVRATGTGIYDFEILGPAIAVYAVPTGQAPQLVTVKDIGPDNPSRKRPMWGAAVATQGKWIYTYGTSNPGKHLVFGWALHVARTTIADVAHPDRWQYWDGHRWQAKPAKAAAIIPAVGGVSEVLSVFHRGDNWYAVSKRDEVLGTDLVIWKAPAPTGPFVASKPLAQIPSNSRNGLLRYMPLAHPDLLTTPGRIVVSYSRNVADLHKLLKDPTLYRPKFLEVPLP